MAFQERLYQLRRRHGLSQEQLAEIVGVTRQAVQKWEAGASRPDMENLTILSRHFGVTLDWLITGEDPDTAPQPEPQPTVVNHYYRRWEYEYKSERTLWGLPLVHIHLCERGFARAKGILAIGNVATGLVSIGVFAVGCFSIGCFALGIFALACLAAGLLAVGGFAAGLAAIGGIVLGWLALGGIALGAYAAGGVVFASEIAIGGVAQAPLAIGAAAEGAKTFLLTPEASLDDTSRLAIQAAISQALGDHRWLTGILCWFIR